MKAILFTSDRITVMVDVERYAERIDVIGGRSFFLQNVFFMSSEEKVATYVETSKGFTTIILSHN